MLLLELLQKSTENSTFEKAQRRRVAPKFNEFRTATELDTFYAKYPSCTFNTQPQSTQNLAKLIPT